WPHTLGTGSYFHEITLNSKGSGFPWREDAVFGRYAHPLGGRRPPNRFAMTQSLRMPRRTRSASGAQEVAHDLDRRFGVLFHDPMAGIGDDGLLDVTGGEAHHGGHHRAERLPAPHSDHPHDRRDLQ